MNNEHKCLEILLDNLNKIKFNTLYEIDENAKEMEINVSSKDFFQSLVVIYYTIINKINWPI